VPQHPAVACSDPIAGVWRALEHDPENADWTVFTLRIHREGTALTGTILVRAWGGGSLERRPVCEGERDFDYTVRMPASGTIQGPQITFGATTWQLLRERCPTPPPYGYNPDQFVGALEAIDVLRVINNDGGRAVNAPITFDRIRCEAPDSEQVPSAPPAPGSATPSTEEAGGSSEPLP
jgi:hypothetical protein